MGSRHRASDRDRVARRQGPILPIVSHRVDPTMNRKSSPRKGAAPEPEKPPKGPAAGSKNPPRRSQVVAQPPRPPTLANLRGEIDRLDQELVKLLNRRAEIAHRRSGRSRTNMAWRSGRRPAKTR